MDLDLQFATIVLRHRLTRPASIDTVVLDPSLSSTLPAKLDDLDGRFVGYFTRRPNGDPCYILLGRRDPLLDFTHIIAFYVRARCRTIQTSEVRPLRSRVAEDLEQGVIVVQHSAPRFCDLSVLIQAVEFSIHPDLIYNFTSVQVIDAHGVISPVCFNASIPMPDCDLGVCDLACENFWSSIRAMNIKVAFYDEDSQPGSLPIDFDVLQIVHEDHQLFGIHHRQHRALMFLLPHSRQFGSQEDFDRIKNNISRALGGHEFQHIGVTRYYGDPSVKCNSVEIAKACVVARLKVMTLVRASDLATFPSTGDLRSMASRMLESHLHQAEDAPELADGQPVEESRVGYVPEDGFAFTSVQFYGEDGYPEVLSSSETPESSQATIIMPEAYIARELELYRYVKGYRHAIETQLVPPVPDICPHTDMTGEILHNKSFFQDALYLLVALWNGYTSVDLCKPTDSEHMSLVECITMRKSYSRFFVFPLIDDSHNMLLIVDRERRCWGYINPDNQAARDADEFKRVERLIHSKCADLMKMPGHPISLTSYFHTEYPGIHLLMSVYALARLFRYAVVLPKRLLYGEREFRKFCHNICLVLQLSNTNHNIENNLVRPDGYLEHEAFVSIPSPVGFERAVVPVDTCPVCLRRSFRDLPRHICMAHGGQASVAYKHRSN